MNLILLAAMTTGGWALYHIFIKLSSEDIHPFLGYVLLNITSLSLGLMGLAYLYFIKGEHLFMNMKGGSYAIAAGTAVLLAELSVFYLFSQKAPISIYVPAMSAGAMVLIAGVGILFLGEKIDLKTATGLLLAIASIFLLAKA